MPTEQQQPYGAQQQQEPWGLPDKYQDQGYGYGKQTNDPWGAPQGFYGQPEQNGQGPQPAPAKKEEAPKVQAAAEDAAESADEADDTPEVIDIVAAEESPEVQAANVLEDKVEQIEDEIADVADAVSDLKEDAEAAEDDGPLDLADLQNKRLGYAAEGLGLEGLIDIFAEENLN